MLTRVTTPLPPGELTDTRRRIVRHELQEAAKYLALSIADDMSTKAREHLEFATAAVRDALRWLNEDADAAVILVALGEIKVQAIMNPAVTHLHLARDVLGGIEHS